MNAVENQVNELQKQAMRVDTLASTEQVLRQLAEEASEVSQAALKMVRVFENTTPVSFQEAKSKLNEEITDVFNCLTVLNKKVNGVCRVDREMQIKKMKRWAERMKERKKNEN